MLDWSRKCGRCEIWKSVFSLTLAMVTGLLEWVGCSSVPSDPPDSGLPALEIEGAEPTTILPGTWVRISGQGFVAAAVKISVRVVGEGGGRWFRDAARVDDTHCRFQVETDFFSELGGPGSFDANVSVEVTYTNGMKQHTKDLRVAWELKEELIPELTGFSPANGLGPTYLGSEVEAEGRGFLMDGEGRTELRLTGSFTPEGSETAQELSDVPIVLGSAERENLAGLFPAEALGIAPGVFRGEVNPVNAHEGGREIAGSGLTGVSIELGPTLLTRMSPASASRGQWLELSGRGFVGGSARTSVQITGSMTYHDGQQERDPEVGEKDFEFVPEVVSGTKMRYVLRVGLGSTGKLEGLGARPGLIEGTVTPIVYLGESSQAGLPLADRVSFTVLPQKQIVFVKFLPGFTDALRLFGLRNLGEELRSRILEVNNRDYRDYSVEFRSARPTDFVEYSVIEVGGEDPNKKGLLGLDATMGKDTGNIYFDDYVGGWNAETEESGHDAFGGVFVDSFLALSPKAPEPLGSITSPRFDDIFGPFMPSQGGKPAERSELPDGSRAEQIDLAVHALGSMIGNTVSHEIGHTLGLAPGDQSTFHTEPSGPNQMMDHGGSRPFAERAEIDGEGPATWTGEDREYLQTYLPQ